MGERVALHGVGQWQVALAARIADRAWAILAERGIRRVDPATWPIGRLSKLQGLARAKIYRPFEDALAPLSDQILGPGGWRTPSGPGPLISFPEPGDGFLMHPWVLHSLAQNTSARVRSMLTHTAFGAGFAWAQDV